jgi:hypothetical protein
MYKKQLRFQKIVCLLAILAAAVCFVYSLGIITDIFDSLKSTMRNPNNLLDTKVPGSIIYYDMQEFNRQFVNMSVGMIVVSCLLFLTNTQVRRKYYIGNYVATCVYCLCAIALSVWSHIEIEAFKHQFLTTVDFEALKAYAEMWKTYYTESTLMLDIHYVTGALLVLSSVLLLGNMVWKICLMRAEKKLLAGGKEAKV